MTRERRLSVATANRAAFLECGGKRSATPLFLCSASRAFAITWRSMHRRITPEWKSALVASLCRRSPKCGSAPTMIQSSALSTCSGIVAKTRGARTIKPELRGYDQGMIALHERISSAAILSRSSVKTNSSSIGLPGKLPVSRLVTMVLPSF